jgi:hypothetical protein
MCDYTRGFLMSTKKGQSSSTVKDVEALAARIRSVYEIIAEQKLKYWEKHLKNLNWFKSLDDVSQGDTETDAKKYMDNLKKLKNALEENWTRFFCPDAKSLQDFGTEHNMDVSLVDSDGKTRTITNVLLNARADIEQLATAIKEEIHKQRVVARTLSNGDALPSRSSSVQHSPLKSPGAELSPRGRLSPQHSPLESPGADFSPRRSPSPQHSPLESPGADFSPRGSPSPQHSPLESPGADFSPRGSPSPQHSPLEREPSVQRSSFISVPLQTPGGDDYAKIGTESPTVLSPWGFRTPGRRDNDNPESNYVYVHNVDQNNLVYIYMIPKGLNSFSDVNNLDQDITSHLSTDINLKTLEDCVKAIHDNKKIDIGLCVVKREEEKLTMGVVSMEKNAGQTFVKFKSASDSDPDIPYWFEKNPAILTLDIHENNKAQAYHTDADTGDDGETLHDVNPELDYNNENHAPVFVIGNDVFSKKAQELVKDVYLQSVQTASNQSAQNIAETLRGLVQAETHDLRPKREAVVAVVKMAFNGPIDTGEAKCMVSFIDEAPQGDIQALPMLGPGGATDSDDDKRASHVLEHFNKQIVDDIFLWNSKKETETERIRNLENASNTCYFDVCIQFFTTNKDIMRVIQHFDIKHSNDREVRKLATNLLEVYEKQQIENGQLYTKKLDKLYPVNVLRQFDRNANVYDQRDDSEFLFPMINIFVSHGPNELKQVMKQVMPQLKCKIIWERHLQPDKITGVNMETTTVLNLRVQGVHGKQAVELGSVLHNSVNVHNEWIAGPTREYEMQMHTVTERRIFLNAPEYLLLYADRNMGRGKKDKRNITMDFNDIKPFLQFECESKCIQEQQYELIYVTTHRGDTTKHSVQGSGHYISHYRLPRTHGDRTNDHVWYRLDDCERNKNNDSFDGPLAVQVPAISLSEDDLTWKDDIEQGSLFVLKKVHNEHRDKYRMFETYSTNINSEEADQIWMSDFANKDLRSMTKIDCQKFLLTEERQSPHIFKESDVILHPWVVESFIPEVLEAVKIYNKKSLKELILDAFPHPNTTGDVGSIVLKYKEKISKKKETEEEDEEWHITNILYNVHSFIGTEGLNLETFHPYNKFNARFAFNWMRPKIMMEHPEHKEAMKLIQECLLQHDIAKCKKQIEELLKYSWVLAAYKHKFLQKYDKKFPGSSSKDIHINIGKIQNSDYLVPALLDVMEIPCNNAEMSLDAVKQAYKYAQQHSQYKESYDDWKIKAQNKLLQLLQKEHDGDYHSHLQNVIQDPSKTWLAWLEQIFTLYKPKTDFETIIKLPLKQGIDLDNAGVQYFEHEIQEFFMQIFDEDLIFTTHIQTTQIHWLQQHLPV